MKWSIPAKTFLLGEYAAMAGLPAMVLTTTPCFEVSLTKQPGLHGIHQESPAGCWWMQQDNQGMGLQWYDPYQGVGGMGASSAQFIGAYLATQFIQKKIPNTAHLLEAYFQCTWFGEGIRPSGYDLLAQLLQGCVYIDKQPDHGKAFAWPFQDIAFLLLHTGQKLATHEHLQTLVLPSQLPGLMEIVLMAKQAIERVNSQQMIDAVNAYHQQLTEMKLVAGHSLMHLDSFKQEADILAAKGCGALGADVLLLLVSVKREARLRLHLQTLGWKILAGSTNLYCARSIYAGPALSDGKGLGKGSD